MPIIAQWQWQSVISGKGADTLSLGRIEKTINIILDSIQDSHITNLEVDLRDENINDLSNIIRNIFTDDISSISIEISLEGKKLFDLSFLGFIFLDDYVKMFIDLATYSDLWMSRDINGKTNTQYTKYRDILKNIIDSISAFGVIVPEETRSTPFATNHINYLEPELTIEDVTGKGRV